MNSLVQLEKLHDHHGASASNVSATLAAGPSLNCRPYPLEAADGPHATPELWIWLISRRPFKFLPLQNAGKYTPVTIYDKFLTHKYKGNP